MMSIRKKPLRCPICGQRIIDAIENNMDTKLVPEKDMDENFIPDYFQKCPKCKNQIAIKKVG